MQPRLPYSLRKKQFIGLASLGILILIFQIGFSFYKSNQTITPPKVEFLSEVDNPILLSEFNPNDLDEKQWKSLGFTEREIATILKYKNMIGGQFQSKEQFKKCYPIVNRYAELEPYVLLPETNKEVQTNSFNYQKYQKKELNIKGKFNPDQLSAKDWEKMGFTENQALAILKYKNYLGGSFMSKEKFKECFIISDDNYHKLAPYLLLPEKVENTKVYNSTPKSKIVYHTFDPNILDLDGWKSLGFSEKQAQVIVNYRDKNLKGSFKTLEDIQKCFVISDEKYQELKPYIQLNPEHIKVNSTQKENNIDAKKPTEAKTDFSKVDLNSISYQQLLEFGLDGKSAGMLIGFRNKLGGFVNKQQILDTYEIDKEKTKSLIETCPLSTASVKRYTLLDAPEDWLKTHPYFKYSADKIIYYRISESNEKKIWKLLKLKPEYEERMKWYLKNE